MAYSTRTYTPGSSTTTFALTTSGGDPIGYIKESDIKVTVNGTEYTNAASGTNTYQISGTSTVEQPNGGNVVLNAGVTGTVKLERTTAIQSATVVYTAGSTLTSTDLNNADNQIRFGLQEFSDDYAALTSGTGNLDDIGGFLGGSDTWVSNNSKAATTAAIDGQIDAKATAKVKDDIIATAPVSIADDSPSAGKITIAVDAKLTELSTMAQNTANALADLTQAEVEILDGASVTTAELNRVDATSSIQTQLDSKQTTNAKLTELGTMAQDTANSLADLTATEVQILDGLTRTTSQLNYVDATSSIQTQIDAKQPLDAELTELATMSTATSQALADLTGPEVNILDGATLSTTELNYVQNVSSAIQTQLDAKQPLDADLTALSSMQTGSAAAIALLTSGEVSILDGATTSTSELNTLTGLTASTGELNKLDGVSSTNTNLNIVSGMTKATSLTANSNSEFPTSKAVADHVTGAVTAVGGFVAIAGPTNFNATQPAQGVVVSIGDVGSGFTVSSQEITITNGAGTGNNVRITGFPTSLNGTIADDVGLQVTSDKNNSTSGSPNVHRYVYHKILAKETDVIQLSDDINDFNERYRVSNGAPSGTDHAGDLYYDTGSDKMLVRNAANNAWEEVQSIGEFFISSFGEAFDGSRIDFTLSNAPANAQQVILSINGVIQKPNSGNSRPSEGFSLNGSTLQLPTGSGPAANTPYWVIVLGSTVNIGAPSAGTVNLSKLDTSNTGSNGQVLSKSGSTEGLTWVDAASEGEDVKSTTNGNEANTKFLRADGDGTCSWQVPPNTQVGGATGVDFNDDIKARWGTGNDLEIFHDNTNQKNVIKNISGSTLPIELAAQTVNIQGVAQSAYSAKFSVTGGQELYFAGNKKAETVTGGFTVTGTCTATSFAGDGSALTGVSSPEVYGFNANASGNLIVTTTNGGSDNISSSAYAAFEDVFFAASGFTFSINASGNLIATI